MKTIILKVQVPDYVKASQIQVTHPGVGPGMAVSFTEIHIPSEADIETAALNYRDKSDDENTDEDTMQIKVHWYDKQKAFISGVKWLLKQITE